MYRLLSLFILTILVTGCGTSDEIQSQQQEHLNMQAFKTVGLPSITKFTEKRQLKLIYELRDKSNLLTYTYLRDENGHFHLLCRSIGYGVPFSTQYSEPNHQEPNGLYPPNSSEATWIICLNPKTKNIEPAYEEDRVTVTLFEMENAK